MRNMYSAYVQSRLIYGLILWGPMCDKASFDDIYKMQKSFVRIINSASHFAESSPLFLKNKILKIHDLLELEFVKQMYQYKNKSLPTAVFNLYNSKMHTYNTRNNAVPDIAIHNSKIYNSSFLCKAISVWNSCQTKYRVLSTIKNVVKVFKYEAFSKY